MSVNALKPDPALTEDEWPFSTPAIGSGEEAMERALWLHRMQEANRAWAQVWKDRAAEAKARQIAKAQEPARQPRATDPDYLDGDYELIGTFQSSDWGD